MDEAEDRPGKVRRMGRLTEPAEEGLLTYGGYLALPELLSLQRLLSDPPVHDELLFITVHQAYELWFKQVVFELEAIRDRMLEGDAERARHYLTRVHAIERVLIEHIEVLQTMSPQDFLEFRSLLSPASGFQSAQFREVEFLSGLKEPRYLKDLAATPEELERLARRLEEPTVWDGFVVPPPGQRARHALGRRGRADGRPAPHGPGAEARRPVRRIGGVARPRRGVRRVAGPPCPHGRAADRGEDRDRRLRGRSTCVRRWTSASSPSCGGSARSSRDPYGASPGT